MTKARFSLLMSILMAHTSIASAIDLFDNLSNVSGNYYQVTTTVWQAQRFTTDNQDYSLSDITLLMLREPETGTGEAVVQIYSNSGTNVPDSPLWTLTSPGSYSETLANTTFTTSGFNLSANSVYWVVLKSGDPGTSFGWSWTENNSGDGVGFSTTWSRSGNSGGDWQQDSNTDFFPYQMKITVQPVPEPSSLTLVGLGVAIALGITGRRQRKSAHRMDDRPIFSTSD